MASPAKLKAPSEPIVTFGVEMEFIAALRKKVDILDDNWKDKVALFESVTEILNRQPTLRVRDFPTLKQENIDYTHGWNLVRDSSLTYRSKEIKSLYPESRLDDLCTSGMELVSPIFHWNKSSIWLCQISEVRLALKKNSHQRQEHRSPRSYGVRRPRDGHSYYEDNFHTICSQRNDTRDI